MEISGLTPLPSTQFPSVVYQPKTGSTHEVAGSCIEVDRSQDIPSRLDSNYRRQFIFGSEAGEHFGRTVGPLIY